MLVKGYMGRDFHYNEDGTKIMRVTENLYAVDALGNCFTHSVDVTYRANFHFDKKGSIWTRCTLPNLTDLEKIGNYEMPLIRKEA